MNYQTILYEKKGNIAKITLNTPEKINALTEQSINELDEAFKAADKDEEVRVIILAGAGASFSPGHDLEAPNWDPNLFTLETRISVEEDLFFDKCMVIRNLLKPTIAQVQGYCIAGALMVAAMCDIIIAAENAQFQNPVCRFASASTELLVEPWEMGVRKAKEFIFTGDFMDAREAWRVGMVNRVVPLEELEKEVMELAIKISKVPPFAIRQAKRSLNDTLDIMGQLQAFKHAFQIHAAAHFSKEWVDFWKQQDEMGGGFKEGGLKVLLETLWPERAKTKS